MGRRFVPVPYEAMSQCGNAREIACIVALYRRAHEERWAPFALSVRDFAKAGEISTGAAANLLHALEVANLIAREPDTHRSRAGKVQVFDPAADLAEHPAEHENEHQKARHDAKRSGGRERENERTREHLTREEVLARVGDHEPEPDPPSEERTPPNPPPTTREDDPAPKWARERWAKPPPGVSRLDVVALVVRCKTAVDGTPPNPERCKTDARPILSLWEADGHRPPEDFAADFEAVAEAARDCPEPLFARDIRAEGWAGGVDRRGDIATICRHERWSIRVKTARAWVDAGRPTGSNSHTAAPPPVQRQAPRPYESIAQQAARLGLLGARDPPPVEVDAPPVSLFAHPLAGGSRGK